MPRATAAAMAGPSETLEFAGVNVMGTTTFINVYDKQTKKGRWISVGGTENGISVLAFDPLRDQVVVKSGDIQKTLTLRKATGVVNAPTPVTVMPAASGFAVSSGANVAPSAPPPSAPSLPAAPPTDAPVAAAPAPVAAKPEAPAKPTTVARQEEEARMLVSDLLEIGMAQRKAYEEAQKKAAAAQTEQASQPAPATTPPGT